MHIYKENRIIMTALRNARSHYPTAELTLEVVDELKDRIQLFGKDGIGRREYNCNQLEVLTNIILRNNNYEGRQRHFCGRGLSCDCLIPCG
jgi:hypothetical protein